MKLGAADFPRLQWSLLAALLMLAVGAGGVYAAYHLATLAERDQRAVQTERDDADRKLRRVRQEEDDIKQKSTVFNELVRRGIVGDERRLEWVEQLKAIRQQRQLLELAYEIAPQRPLTALPGSSYGYFASAMKLQLKLLHEEDLTRLLADLHEQASALILVRSCDVSRLAGGNAEARTAGGVQAKLQADCLLDWVTLREVAAK